MDLLEDGGRKFVELGSGASPEEEGVDVAITLWDSVGPGGVFSPKCAVTLSQTCLISPSDEKPHTHWKDR